MGPAGHQAARPSQYIADFHPHALLSPESELDSPPATTHTHLSSAQQSPEARLKRAFLTFHDTAGTAVPTEPEPGHVALRPKPGLTTPQLADAPTHTNMNLIVGGALAPMPSTATSNHQRKSSRPSPGLRLPSFQELGIAAPHPDRFGSLSFSDEMAGSLDGATLDTEADSSKRADSGFVEAFDALSFAAVQLGRPQIQPKLPANIVRTPFRQDVATLTPPAETGDHAWLSVPITSTSNPPMHSPASEPESRSPAFPEERTEGVESSSEESARLSPNKEPQSWIDDTLQVLLNDLRGSAIPNNPLRVLSHALPSPSPSGHIYSNIISAISGSTPSDQTEWINVFHAIPGRFNLAELPTSPPSTPGPAVGGEDYFTKKVFDSAVPISDYQEDLSKLPRSPLPVVPPSSINLAIVERYIPPTGLHEFKDMFNPSGPSLLVDRLVELSPNKGSLVFIYPTKTGAQIFKEQYIGPIIEPLLRSIQVVNGLPSDLSRTLGTMAAVKELPEFDQLHRSMETLCARLTQRGRNSQSLAGQRATTFTVVHSSKARVPLTRETWSRDWWSKQEKPKIREAMAKYVQEAQKRSSNREVERSPTPTELITQLLDGVLKRPYPPGQEPTDGIEVSVFVVQRSE